jgi:hypothetical protein
MLEELKLCLSCISKEELLVQIALEAKALLLAELELKSNVANCEESVVVTRETVALTTQRDTLSFKKASNEITVQLYGDIAGYNRHIAKL